MFWQAEAKRCGSYQIIIFSKFKYTILLQNKILDRGHNVRGDPPFFGRLSCVFPCSHYFGGSLASPRNWYYFRGQTIKCFYWMMSFVWVLWERNHVIQNGQPGVNVFLNYLTLNFYSSSTKCIVVFGFFSPTDGLVKVGIVGELPFMSHKFETQLTIHYIGISTGWGSTGTWTFCGFGKKLFFI